MPRSSIDNAGAMPFETFLQKQEQTPMFEDPESFHEFSRGLLKDFRPEAPFFAHEAPLENNMAEQRLNFQYGDGWSEKKPDLPDGTFLDFEFLQQDPRGHTTDINFGGYLKERGIRYSLIPKTSDDSPTIHEGPIGTPLYQNMRDQANDRFRQQYKNFETSRDGWTGGRLMSRPQGCTIDTITSESKPYLVDEGILYNKSNILPTLEMANPVGYNTTTSQDYKIGSFSQIRSTRSLADDDWGKNRRNTYHDQEIRVRYRDAVVPKSVALNMIDLSQKKYNEMQSLRNYEYQNSRENPLTKKHKLIADTLNGRNQTNAALTMSAMQEADFGSRKVNLVPRIDSNRMLKHRVTNDTAKAIVAATRAGALEIGDLRDRVMQSILNPESTTGKNRAIGPMRAENGLGWEAEDDRKEQAPSYQIGNFKMIKPKVYSPADQAANLQFDDFRATSFALDPRTLVNVNALDAYDSALADGIDFKGSLGVANASMASLGSKYMRGYMSSDQLKNEVFDL